MSKFLTAETLTNPGKSAAWWTTSRRTSASTSRWTPRQPASLAIGLRDVRGSDVVSFTLPTLGIGTSTDGQSIVLRDDAAIDGISKALADDSFGSYVQDAGLTKTP